MVVTPALGPGHRKGPAQHEAARNRLAGRDGRTGRRRPRAGVRRPHDARRSVLQGLGLTGSSDVAPKANRRRCRSTGSQPMLRLTWASWWHNLTAKDKKSERLKPHELTFILRTLATLVSNGVSLPKALGTLARKNRSPSIATFSTRCAARSKRACRSARPWRSSRRFATSSRSARFASANDRARWPTRCSILSENRSKTPNSSRPSSRSWPIRAC